VRHAPLARLAARTVVVHEQHLQGRRPRDATNLRIALGMPSHHRL
jgi:hypothetical protein